ncbi:MAG: hypothetical protein ACKVX9_16320 [Blastocatellia bacterium]
MMAQAIASAGAGAARDNAQLRYHYLFENPRFLVPVQEVEFDGAGHGRFRFQRKDQEETILTFEVSGALLSKVQSLFDALNFLESSEDYQHKKDFSHLGIRTITLSRGGRARTVRFSYTDNQSLNRLADVFQDLATQETRFFEMEAIRANDPISTPAQLRLLESELRSKHIADPVRFEKVLQEIKLDEGVPLIARNHADRLLQMIHKGK